MNKIKKCANIIKCVGILSEIKLDYIHTKDNIICKGYFVLRIDNKYIKFNVFTNKKSIENYYDLIEIMGVQYDFFKQVDNDNYTLDEQLIKVGLSGRINLYQDKILTNSISLKPTKRPTSLFVVGKLTEYGCQSTYVQRTNVNNYIEFELQGIPHKLQDNLLTLVLVSNSNDNYAKVIELKYYGDKIYDDTICNLKLKYNKPYDIQDNVISNVHKFEFIVDDIIPTENKVDDKIIQQAIIEYNILKNAKKI
jgi:hypothetical protein